MQQIYVLKFILILKFLWHSTKTNSDPGTSYFVNKKKTVFEVKWFTSEERTLYYLCHT